MFETLRVNWNTELNGAPVVVVMMVVVVVVRWSNRSNYELCMTHGTFQGFKITFTGMEQSTKQIIQFYYISKDIFSKQNMTYFSISEPGRLCVQSSLEEMEYLFTFISLVPRQSATLSSAVQHAMSPERSGQWGAKCANTRFPAVCGMQREAGIIRVQYKSVWCCSARSARGRAAGRAQEALRSVSVRLLCLFIFYNSIFLFPLFGEEAKRGIQVRHPTRNTAVAGEIFYSRLKE